MCRKLTYIGLLLMVLSLNQPVFSEVSLAGSWSTGLTHTKEAGTNRALIFIAHGENSSTVNLSAVTYGGQSMTKIVDRYYYSGNGAYVAAYILNEVGVAAATNNNFIVTWNTTPAEVKYASVFLCNVNQTAPNGASGGGESTSNPVTTPALSTNDGDMVIDAATCGNRGTYTLQNGFTQGAHQSSDSSTGVTGYKPATGASETPSATHTSVNRQVIIGFVIKEAITDPNKASNPSPSNGAASVDVATNLSWTAGAGATSHDIYFGINSDSHSNPKHTIDTNSYNPPGDLAEGTDYYWAVDSNASGTVTVGEDWSFTTYAPIDGDLVANYVISLDMPGTTYYADICAYYGVLVWSELTGNTSMRDSIIAKFPTTYYTGATMPPRGEPQGVDKGVYGIYPFELYRQTRDANYLVSALYLADDEFNPPTSDGLCKYTRFWIDDTYMVGSLQIQAYKSMGDIIYANRATVQLLGYMGEVEQLQQPNGLFYHTTSAPIHWGRGNGWAASAMTEVLLALPEDDPNRPELLSKYQAMMSGLVTYQGASGMWYQVLDMGSDPRNWYESSCTAMFVFALTTGVDKGWLPEEPYLQAALDGWAALADYVDEQGRVHEVCTGTGASSDVQYYFDRPREIGNTHAEAAVIWAATAMERLNSEAEVIDFDDLKMLTDNWLGDEPAADIFPPGGDGIVNFLDFAELA